MIFQAVSKSSSYKLIPLHNVDPYLVVVLTEKLS